MPVYFVHQEERDQWRMKIGRAKNLRQRLRQLQTGNPKELKIVGWIVSDDDNQTERSLHRKYKARNVGGEWFALRPADILEDLRSASIEGFVAKNFDAFEIIGHDRDGIPEHIGVWDWADLEIDECCPFCGCMCGMDFQDVSQMYHCRHCDALTDFSEMSPPLDNEEDYLFWKAQQEIRKATRPKPAPRKRFSD